MFRLSHILLNPKKAERHPVEMLLVGFFYTSLSIFLSLWIFPENTSLVMIFFTVISCLYVIQGAIIVEENKEKDYNSEKWLLRSHFRTLSFLMFLFLGFLLAFAFWTITLPDRSVSSIFSLQQSTVEGIKSITGNSISTEHYLPMILSNNFKVLLFSLLFSVFYGAGAVFILAWNASIMGFVIGSLAKSSLGPSHLPVIFTKYFLHGIPEMLAYFVAALAGGIIFISIIRGDINKGRIKRIVIDTFSMIAIAAALIVIAALIEVYISPYV